VAVPFGALLLRGCGPGIRMNYKGLAPTFNAYLVFCILFCAHFGLGLIFNLLVMPDITNQKSPNPMFSGHFRG